MFLGLEKELEEISLLNEKMSCKVREYEFSVAMDEPSLSKALAAVLPLNRTSVPFGEFRERWSWVAGAGKTWKGTFKQCRF